MEFTDHPAPDPQRLLGQFDEWSRGETLPGRMLANLKTGRLPEVLEALGEPAQGLADWWDKWEKGTALPDEVTAALAEGGLRKQLEALTNS